MGSCIVLLKDLTISLYVRHNIRGKNLINITLACEIALDQVNFSGLPDFGRFFVVPFSRYFFMVFETVFLWMLKCVEISLIDFPAMCIPKIIARFVSLKYGILTG